MSLLRVNPRQQGPASLLKQLRKQGLVPLALIDSDHNVLLLQASARDTRIALATTGGVGRLNIQVEGEKKERQVVVKAVDQDLMKHELLSVTLSEVRAEDKIKVDLEVFPVGVPGAVADGAATLTQPTSHVKVRGKIADLPEKIEVDVSHMELQHAYTAGELVLPEGVELLSSSDATLFSVQLNRAAHDAVEEVIGQEAATPTA